MSEWKLNKIDFVMGMFWRTIKYLGLPWALRIAIFDYHFPMTIELANFYFVLMITLYIFNLHTFLAHLPMYQKVDENE